MSTDQQITINGLTLTGPPTPREKEVCTAEALEFLSALHRRFGDRAEQLRSDEDAQRNAQASPAAASGTWRQLMERHLEQEPAPFITPRALGAEEPRIRCGEAPLSAGIVDFGLHIHSSARRLLHQGRAPFISLLGLETEAELELWQDLFAAAEEMKDLPFGTIRAIHLAPRCPEADEEDAQDETEAVLVPRTPPAGQQQKPLARQLEQAA
ncbi:hypothetical protein [Nesterenkonia sp.]|uniref:hypothetical protein n=1 Tax=Nesterenkonia sp. TaxID=704201 RepID=UPI0026200C6F|nr:hypothetical protein [Nesterenkonia sp.]